MTTIGEKIRYFRKRKGFSQEDLAHELDVSLTAYSKIERNVTDINFSRLSQIAKVLDVTLVEMLSLDKEGRSWTNENERLKKIIADKDKQIAQLQEKVIKHLDNKKGKKK